MEAHRALGTLLREVRTTLLEVRQLISAGEGSASREYAAASKVLKELTSLETLLHRTAVGQHGDTQPLQLLKRLYGETPQQETPS